MQTLTMVDGVTASLVALQRSDAVLFEVVAADLKYLLERRHDALLPQVRFGITQSIFADVFGEVRSHIPGQQALVRTLSRCPRTSHVARSW